MRGTIRCSKFRNLITRLEGNFWWNFLSYGVIFSLVNWKAKLTQSHRGSRTVVSIVSHFSNAVIVKAKRLKAKKNVHHREEWKISYGKQVECHFKEKMVNVIHSASGIQLRTMARKNIWTLIETFRQYRYFSLGEFSLRQFFPSEFLFL